MPQNGEIRSVDLNDSGIASFHVHPLNDFSYSPSQEGRPHRHNFQELIWIESGSGKQAIDGEVMEIASSTFYLIAKGQIHQFLAARDINGFVLRFSDDFKPQYGSTKNHHFSEAFFNNVQAIPTLSIEGNLVSDFGVLFKIIEAEYKKPNAPGKNAILRHLLQVLLIKIVQNIDEETTGEGQANLVHDSVFKNFLSLLEDHYKAHHDVAFYGDTLAITPRQLSDRTKQVTGKTAKQVIEERITLEAKRALKFTDKPIKEIAYDLGYDDPSYFSKVFKRVTNHTPLEFQAL